jgi:hypothetical protein
LPNRRKSTRATGVVSRANKRHPAKSLRGEYRSDMGAAPQAAPQSISITTTTIIITIAMGALDESLSGRLYDAAVRLPLRATAAVGSSFAGFGVSNWESRSTPRPADRFSGATVAVAFSLFNLLSKQQTVRLVDLRHNRPEGTVVPRRYRFSPSALLDRGFRSIASSI